MNSHRMISDARADTYLIIALCVLLFNFASQVAAMPFQFALVVYAVIKADVRLLPGLFITILDKSNFTYFHASLMKFSLGLTIGVQNVFVILVFLYVVYQAVFRGKFGIHLRAWLIPWWICAIPALYIALCSRRDGLSAWQQAIVEFMTPALYYWGCVIGSSWPSGRNYFIKRMILVFTVCSILNFSGHLYIFSFAQNAIPVALAFAAIRMKIGFIYQTLSVGGALASAGATLFARYVAAMGSGRYVDSADVGSTFTTMATYAFTLILAYSLGKVIKQAQIVRALPLFVVGVLLMVFLYAVNRVSVKGGEDVDNDYRSWSERFEYKLVGDRGVIWSEGVDDALKPPYVFKRQADFLVEQIDPYTGQYRLAMKIPPHNQVLTLLVRDGWWFGLFCICFLFMTHFRMYRCLPDLLFDPAVCAALVASSSSVFYAVGLTGQSVWTDSYIGNGLVTIIFPGIVYGAWLTLEQKKRSIQL